MADGQRRYRDRDRDRDRDRGRNRNDRGRRDWDRDYDQPRRRDRSRDRRDDGWRGGGRDYRHRSRSRSRSPARRRNRSRDDRDYRSRRRGDSTDRVRRSRENTADAPSRSAAADASKLSAAGSARAAPPASSTEKSEAEKKAERLAKLEAWKKKHEQKQRIENDAANSKKLLAASEGKPDASPAGTASPSTPGEPTAAASQTAQEATYSGKFDPKAIAKKSAARHHSPDLLVPPVKAQAPAPSKAPVAAAFKKAMPKAATSSNNPFVGFSFNKGAGDAAAAKRKLDLDDNKATKRTLTKLPDASLEETDDTPYNNQDDDDEEYAATEEEFATAARAAKERREQRLLQQGSSKSTDEAAGTEADALPETNGTSATEAASEPKPADIKKSAPVPEPEAMEVDPKPAVPRQNGVNGKSSASMDVDMDDNVDPLDAFMAGLDSKTDPSTSKLKTKKPNSEPVAYFSDDEDYFAKGQEGVDATSILAIAAKRKKKDIPKIDYTKLELTPVRKNFWVEPHELSELSEAEVAELRLDLDGIKVSGKDIPKPVQKWSHCGLIRPMLDVIAGLGYDKPTPIQMQAVPAIMSGRDVVGVAKTGSGKTMAYLVPMFRHIMDQERVRDNEGPIGLILTPTRELAVQIHKDCKPFAKMLGLRTVCAYGGPPIKDQIAGLKRGAEIIVATTGRMIDLLAANQGRVVSLKRTTYIVLDEADRMFDMGFEPQVMKIFGNVRPDCQTLLFSATMPRIIDSLAKKVLHSPIEITVGGKSVVAPEIAQIVEIREEKDKFLRLLELLGELYMDDDDVRSLIFVERQEKADELLRELLRKGYGCMSLHGGKDQVDRDSTISDFKNGVCPVLVATSVAARGLDVKQLKLVVNYDAPNHLEDYVHRVGRTGRAGNTGTAVTFVTEEQENCAPGICKALEQSGQPVPERLAEMRKTWREKVKAGKAKDQSGFGGKGLEKLDKDREAARQRERKTHKAEGDDEDFDNDNKKTSTEDDDDKASNAKGGKAATLAQGAASAIVSRETAKAAADAFEGKSSGVIAGAAAGGALEKAASAISDINARLARAGQLRPGQPIDNKGPDAGAFHATLEINDFPQKARWAVTNRTNVAKILDSTGTSITTKGTFYGAGKEPQAGQEPKLYLLIEGDTEVAVGNALTELTRLLREGTVAAADAESRAPAAGRYTIT